MLDKDVTRGIDVDAIGGWPTAALLGADEYAIDGHVGRIADVHGPEAGAPQAKGATKMNVCGVEDLDEARASGVVVGCPAEAAGLIAFAETPVAVPEYFAVAVDGAFAVDGWFGLLVDVDERGGPRHLDAGDAGGHDGIVGESLRAEEGDALVDAKGDIALHENRTDELGPGGKRYRALSFGDGIDGLLNGCSIESYAVTLGAKVFRVEACGAGRRSAGGDCNQGNSKEASHFCSMMTR